MDALDKALAHTLADLDRLAAIVGERDAWQRQLLMMESERSRLLYWLSLR